jgi:hypothetical protein
MIPVSWKYQAERGSYAILDLEFHHINKFVELHDIVLAYPINDFLFLGEQAVEVDYFFNRVDKIYRKIGFVTRVAISCSVTRVEVVITNKENFRDFMNRNMSNIMSGNSIIEEKEHNRNPICNVEVI